MYELLCKEFGRDTGVFFQTRDEAVAEATDGDEIWQVADDVSRTRMLCVWPISIERRNLSAAWREP